ncbi:SDR family NAD(P)-dependent oxidoreductase [Novosphingobium sp. 9]|uniref:SDR family NAD(P)-dependent oxidoreductase n=1 Tax=Novosphingobium sp. 9 TaxID=2025349 RepID=UPI0021B5A654|nr:SDR family oxidoreductase [Novosphingobium sp. 9]
MAGILIIGGAGGLGGELARSFAGAGDRVLLADEGEVPRELPDAVRFEAVALESPDTGTQAVAAALEHADRLDTVIVAASAMASAPVAEWTAAMWDRASAVNLRLPFLTVQAALPALRISSNASVIFISSTATMRGQPLTHAYQATKAGVAGLVRSLAAELGPEGVRVNAVLGGWLDTPLTRGYWQMVPDAETERARVDGRIPLRRHGSAAEAAALVRFLASHEASYISGAMMPVDGGDTAV